MQQVSVYNDLDGTYQPQSSVKRRAELGLEAKAKLKQPRQQDSATNYELEGCQVVVRDRKLNFNMRRGTTDVKLLNEILFSLVNITFRGAFLQGVLSTTPD